MLPLPLLNVATVAVVIDAAVAVISLAEAEVIKYSKQLVKLTYTGGSHQMPSDAITVL